jgi:alpha-tubulin suppressor-like RCC1 family protein
MAASAALAMALMVVGTASQASAAPPSDRVLAWGGNFYGELGNGTNSITGSNLPVFVSLPAGTKVTAVAASGGHSLALTSTGKVLAWGNNDTGQLGNGTIGGSSNLPVFVSLPAGVTVTAIAAGVHHSLAVTSTGKVLAWGDNTNGQLGTGSNNPSTVPAPVFVLLPAGVTVTAVAGGGYHSLAVTSTGKVLAWGLNSDGQLGTGSNNPSTAPVFVLLPAGTTVTAIAAGFYHSLAVTSTGRALAWGANGSGPLGDGTKTSSNTPVTVLLPAGTTVTAIAGGNNHSLAVTSVGRVLAWGNNSVGQLGIGTNDLSTRPVFVLLPVGTTVTAIAAAGFSLAIKAPVTPPPTGLPITGSAGGEVWLAIALTMISTGGVLLVVANRWARRRCETH